MKNINLLYIIFVCLNLKNQTNNEEGISYIKELWHVQLLENEVCLKKIILACNSEQSCSKETWIEERHKVYCNLEKCDLNCKEKNRELLVKYVLNEKQKQLNFLNYYIKFYKAIIKEQSLKKNNNILFLLLNFFRKTNL